MDIDSTAVWIATRSRSDFAKLREAGMNKDLLVGQWKSVWEFISGYESEHSEMPGVSIVMDRFGTRVREPEDVPATGYLMELAFKRAIFLKIQEGMGEIAESMETGDVLEASKIVHRFSDDVRNVQRNRLGIKEIADVVGGVREMYDLTKSGEIGVPFPWDAMNDMTMGMWPGTLTFLSARPGIGKTFAAIVIAWNAFVNHGKKILIVSPEMGAVELAERIVAREGRIGYGGIVSGTLGDMGGEAAMDETIARIKEMRGFAVLDDNERLESSAIEDAIAAEDPDLILIDSVYMLRCADGKVKGNKGGSRYDRILNTIDWMRTLTRRTMKPVIGVSQLSRDAKMTKSQEADLKKGMGTGGLENTLAMSDTLLWDTNNLFAMFQDADMKLDKQMMFVPLKARRMAKWSALVTNWNMETMDFDQIGTSVDSGSEYKDDDYADVF